VLGIREVAGDSLAGHVGHIAPPRDSYSDPNRKARRVSAGDTFVNVLLVGSPAGTTEPASVRDQTCVFPSKDDCWTEGLPREAKLAHLARQAAFQRHVLGPKSRFSWTGATVVLPVAPNVTRICGEL
jgi:hypothetical protein